MKVKTQSYKKLTEYISETFKMQYVFTRDMQKIMDNTERAKSSERQFWFRLVVRTAIDNIDAIRLRLSSLALEIIKMRGDEKKLHPKPRNNNLKYFFKKLTVAINSSFDVEADSEQYKNYYDAREIRRRVTHPKELDNLKISREDYIKVIKAYGWFDNCLKQISRQSTKANKER